jgi:hypothetical protein
MGKFYGDAFDGVISKGSYIECILHVIRCNNYVLFSRELLLLRLKLLLNKKIHRLHLLFKFLFHYK